MQLPSVQTTVFIPDSLVFRRGVDVQVAPGQPPVTVNPDAGKSNLNVDKFDGRDEEDFLSSRTYKKSSGLVTSPVGGGNVPILVRCDTNDTATGFSAVPEDKNDTISSISATFGGYLVEFQDNGGQEHFVVEVICSDNARPFFKG